VNVLFNIAPLEQAVEKFGARSVVASRLRSADWAEVPLALRERALFSAGVENARWLATVQEKIGLGLRLQREQVRNGAALVDRSSLIGDLRKLAFAEGLATGRGDLQDMASRTRLGLIYDMQVQGAQGFAGWKMNQDPDVLEAFPAQELIREESRRAPRDWPAIWTQKGGRLVDGRMAALKTDAIWEKISRFGTPWPPFDYGSGMGLRELSRAEAETLELLEPGAPASWEEQGFNDRLEASAENLKPEDVALLQRQFGDQIAAAPGGKVKWNGSLIKDLSADVMRMIDQGGKMLTEEWRGRQVNLGRATATTIEKARGLADLSQANLQIRPDNIYKMWLAHGPSGEKREGQRPLKPEDFELIPFVWRDPDEIVPGNRGNSLEFRKRLTGRFAVIEWGTKDNRSWAPTTMYVKEEPGVSPSPKRRGDTSKTTTPDSEAQDIPTSPDGNAFVAATLPLRKRLSFGDQVAFLDGGKATVGVIAGSDDGTGLEIELPGGTKIRVKKADLRMPKGGFRAKD
jgi:hypothetical protein